MRKKFILFLCVLFIFTLSGCGNKVSGDLSSKELTVKERVIAEASMERNTIGKIVNKKVKLSVKESEGEVTITVNAPIATAQFIEWINSVDPSTIDNKEIEKELKRIINKEKAVEKEYVFSVTDNMVFYSDEYLNHISCGLNDFYQFMMDELITIASEDEEVSYE